MSLPPPKCSSDYCNCGGSVYPRERCHSRFCCRRWASLYFLGNRASSARSVGIGVPRTSSNSNAEVSALLRRTNCVPMMSKLWPFKSVRFSGPMSSHIKFSLSHAKSFMPTPAGSCAQLSDSTKCRRFGYPRAESKRLKNSERFQKRNRVTHLTLKSVSQSLCHSLSPWPRKSSEST